MEMESKAHSERERTHEVNAQECRNSSVCVYRDRAEVVRIISLSALQAPATGEHTILLHSLTRETNPESIRVKGTAGCEILEVSHELKRASTVSTPDTAMSTLKNKISQHKKDLKALSHKIEQVSKERKLIQSYADNAMSKGKDQASLSLSDARELISFHTSEMIRLDDKECELREQSALIDEVLDHAKHDLAKLSSPAAYDKQTSEKFSTSYSVSIVVDLEAHTNTELLELQFSYVVYNASWTPSYDLRINSVSNELSLSYFAEVTQCTGEDWNDCRLSLSTSNPATGSAPPPLPRSTVHFEVMPYSSRLNKINSKKMKKSTRRSTNDSDSDYSDEDGNGRFRNGSFSLMDDEELPPSSSFAPNAETTSPGRISAQGTGDAGSTVFLIPRAVTIASDSKPHKVTVMIASLSPQMVHYVAPSVSSHAYIQAKTQNTSQYPLLASRSVSVFLDGNFVASSSSIDQTSSGEYFSVYLGVDPALKVTHTPCRTTQQTKGWLNGTQVKKAHYSTVLHNTKQRPCKVIVAEVLPRSSNDKIVVELIEPSASCLTKSSDSAVVTSERDVLAALDSYGEGLDSSPSSSDQHQNSHAAWPKDFVTQNKYTNNIVWLKTIPAGDKVELKFSYKISWPQGQNVAIDML